MYECHFKISCDGYKTGAVRFLFFLSLLFFFALVKKGHFCEELCQYSFFRTEVGGEDAGLYQIGD